MLDFYVEPLLIIFLSEIFFFCSKFISFCPFCISSLHFLSWYLILRSFFFLNPFFAVPISFFFSHLFSFLLQNLVFTALSCKLKMESEFACCLHSLTLPYPRISLAEERPNTALYYYPMLAKLVMYVTEHSLKAFPLRVIGECVVYLLLDNTEMLW